MSAEDGKAWVIRVEYRLPIGRQFPVFVPDVPPENATLWTKQKRIRRELALAIKTGLRITPKADRRHRMDICDACKYYLPAGNWGLGECRAPGCGCTRAKLWIAGAKCPLPVPKWTAVTR
jgi:hypothetical protein